MKKIIVLVILLFTLSPKINAQWFWQNTLPQGNTLNDVSFYDDYFGLAVGKSGTILKSTDGGLNWTTIETNFNNEIKKVKIVSTQIAYLLFAQQIMKSTDAGETWFNISNPPLNTYSNFEFINENKWYVTGSSNNIYYTTDGGNNWIALPTGVSARIGSIDFLDENFGIMAGYTPYENVVLKTTDGGLTWSHYFFSNATLLQAPDIKVLSLNRAFIIGYNSLLRTTDGGINWEWVYFNSSDPLFSIEFHDSLNGFISSVSRIITTSDGGITWIEKNLNIGSNIWLYGMSVPSPNLIYAVGLYGKMIYSTDQSNSWKEQSSGPIISFYDVSFSDATHGIAVSGSKGVLTTNGGASWIINNGSSGYRCSMPSNSICFSAGGYNLAKSTDGGFTWAKHPISNDHHFMTILSHDSANGVATSMLGVESKVFRTFDCGDTWSQISSIEDSFIKDICFADSSIIYAC